MKFSLANARNVLSVTGVENCDTDSWPLVSEIVFRRYQGTFDPELGAVAAAILFSGHCGTVAEFDGVNVGLEAAKGIRCVAPEIDEVLPIDGRKKEMTQGGRTMVVVEAAEAFDAGIDLRSLGRSARAVTWSGDPVPPDSRDSSEYVCGEIFTNARLVAGGMETSVALALLIGGRSLRDIHVATPKGADPEVFDRVAEGLDCVGIKLRAL